MTHSAYKDFKSAVLRGGGHGAGEPTTRGSRQEVHGKQKCSVYWGLLGAALGERLCFRADRNTPQLTEASAAQHCEGTKPLRCALEGGQWLILRHVKFPEILDQRALLS